MAELKLTSTGNVGIGTGPLDDVLIVRTRGEGAEELRPVRFNLEVEDGQVRLVDREEGVYLDMKTILKEGFVFVHPGPFKRPFLQLRLKMSLNFDVAALDRRFGGSRETIDAAKVPYIELIDEDPPG